MRIVRAGIDTLCLAIRARLPPAVLAQLAEAKAQAADERRDVPIELGEARVRALIQTGGLHGGYAFVFDTGLVGSRFACRADSDKQLDWNLFVKPHATAFLSQGFRHTVRGIIDTLADLGAETTDIHPNRIDYAIDVRADDFVLDIHRFVAHPRATRRPHWGPTDEHNTRAVLAGRRLESVTIGRPTGWEIIVYDKTAEARARHKLYWFEAWQISADDRLANIHRIELRLCRDEIKRAWRFKSLTDLESGLRPALCSLMQRVRYTAADDANPNVTRRKLDPIWQLGQRHIATADLLGPGGDLPPSRLLEITRDMKTDCHLSQIKGNTAALAAAMDLDDGTIQCRLPDIVSAELGKAIQTENFRRSHERAKQRYSALFSCRWTREAPSL
jgi:hypothetical protein